MPTFLILQPVRIGATWTKAGSMESGRRGPGGPSMTRSFQLRSFSHLRMNENLDPLNKNRRKRAVLTVGLERGLGCAVPRSSGGTPAFSLTSYGCIKLIRDSILNIVLQGVPKKVVDIILRASGSKNWSPDIALKILLATVENRIFHLYCFFRVALHFLKTAVNIMMRAE